MRCKSCLLFGGKCECSDENAIPCKHFLYKDTIINLQDEIARLRDVYESSFIRVVEYPDTISIVEIQHSREEKTVFMIDKMIPAAFTMKKVFIELYREFGVDDKDKALAEGLDLNIEESRILMALLRISRHKK